MQRSRCVELQLWERLEFVGVVQKFPGVMEQEMGQLKDRVRPGEQFVAAMGHVRPTVGHVHNKKIISLYSLIMLSNLLKVVKSLTMLLKFNRTS